MIESILSTAAPLAAIFGWAFLSFWSAIPAGVALGVTPALVALTVTLSYASGVALVLIVGAPLRERIQRRIDSRRDGENVQPSRMMRAIRQAWDRFGLLGLSLLAPVTVGAQVGAVIGLSFGAKPLRLLIAMTIGAALWAVGLTLAIVAGVMAVTG